MSYEAKTDWKYDDTPTEVDANRWEKGIKDAHDGLDNIKSTAESTSIEDAGGYFASDNVEGALQEIGYTFNGSRVSLIDSVNQILRM